VRKRVGEKETKRVREKETKWEREKQTNRESEKETKREREREKERERKVLNFSSSCLILLFSFCIVERSYPSLPLVQL